MKKKLIIIVAMIFSMQSFIFANYAFTSEDQTLLGLFEEKLEQLIEERGEEERQNFYDLVTTLAQHPQSTDRFSAMMWDLSTRLSMNGQINNTINIDGDNNQVAVTNNQNSNNTTTIVNNNTTIVNNTSDSSNNTQDDQTDNDNSSSDSNETDQEPEYTSPNLIIDRIDTPENITVPAGTNQRKLFELGASSTTEGAEVKIKRIDLQTNHSNASYLISALYLYVDGELIKAIGGFNINSDGSVSLHLNNLVMVQDNPLTFTIKADIVDTDQSGTIQFEIKNIVAIDTHTNEYIYPTFNGTLSGGMLTIESNSN